MVPNVISEREDDSFLLLGNERIGSWGSSGYRMKWRRMHLSLIQLVNYQTSGLLCLLSWHVYGGIGRYRAEVRDCRKHSQTRQPPLSLDLSLQSRSVHLESSPWTLTNVLTKKKNKVLTFLTFPIHPLHSLDTRVGEDPHICQTFKVVSAHLQLSSRLIPQETQKSMEFKKSDCSRLKTRLIVSIKERRARGADKTEQKEKI